MTTLRDLHARIEGAELAVIRALPFLREVALRGEVRLTRTGTARVDRHGCVYLNPAWIASLSDRALVYVLAHELMHVFLRSFARGNELDAARWNVAHDLVINRELTAMLGIDPPQAWALAAETTDSGEDIYYALENTLSDLMEEAGPRDDLAPAPEMGAGAHLRQAERGPRDDAVLDAEDDDHPWVDVQRVCAERYTRPAPGIPRAIGMTVPRESCWPTAWNELGRPDAYSRRQRTWSRASRRYGGGREPVYAGRTSGANQPFAVALDMSPSLLEAGLEPFAQALALARGRGYRELTVLAWTSRGVARRVVDPANLELLIVPDCVVELRESGEPLMCPRCGNPQVTRAPDVIAPDVLDLEHAVGRDAELLILSDHDAPTDLPAAWRWYGGG